MIRSKAGNKALWSTSVLAAAGLAFGLGVPSPAQQAGVPGAPGGAEGGGLTHWTRNTPRPHPDMELIPCIQREELLGLYSEAESMLGTRLDLYSRGVRQQAIKSAIQAHLGAELMPGYEAQDLPVAGKPADHNPDVIISSGVDTILGDLAEPGNFASETFRVLAEHSALRINRDGGSASSVTVFDVKRNEEICIEAEHYIIAGGAVMTPALLFESGIRPPALGRYITDHTLTFAQVELHAEIRRDIPDGDSDPMLWIPVQPGRPWHCQVHVDTFPYGDLPVGVDPLSVVDLRSFGVIEPRLENRMLFEVGRRSPHGMLQPRFEFALSDDDASRLEAMKSDMENVARALGSYVRGSEPRVMPLGAALHLQGTTRLGPADDGTSVADPNGRVWGFHNLFVGGNGVIPTMNACNPTLTNVALAIGTARAILRVRGSAELISEPRELVE